MVPFNLKDMRDKELGGDASDGNTLKFFQFLYPDTTVRVSRGDPRHKAESMARPCCWTPHSRITSGHVWTLCASKANQSGDVAASGTP